MNKQYFETSIVLANIKKDLLKKRSLYFKIENNPFSKDFSLKCFDNNFKSRALDYQMPPQASFDFKHTQDFMLMQAHYLIYTQRYKKKLTKKGN